MVVVVKAPLRCKHASPPLERYQGAERDVELSAHHHVRQAPFGHDLAFQLSHTKVAPHLHMLLG